MNVLLIAPSVFIVLVLRYYHHWITEGNITELRTKKLWSQVFYTTCYSFIGFNILSSLTIKLSDTNPTQILDIPIVYVYSIIFSPLLEELICRKLLFSWLDRKFGFILAATISSLLFAILHFNLAQFFGFLWIGMVMAWSYKRSENILVPILAHATYNYITILIMSIGG